MPNQVPPPRSSAPTFILHTPAVDFIENRMSQYHPAFDTTGFRYSPTQSQFIPVSSPSNVTYPSILAPLPASPALPSPRPTPSSTNDMGFWASIFPEAIKRLNQEPLPYSGPYQRQWGIRHLSMWPDVQAKLDMARRDYDFYNGQQHVGKFRRKLRFVADKATVPLQQGAKLIPDIDIASPVISVIGLLLDAYRQASEVRETVNTGFDDLPEVFTRIDFYFQSYPRDSNIFMASVELVLVIFKAIEEAVRFYTSPQATRAGRIILTGEEYQKKLLYYLKEIGECSNRLEIQTRMSFTHRIISDSNETRKSHATIIQDNWTTHQTLGAILHGQLVGRAEGAWIGNLLNQLLRFFEDREKNWPPGLPIPSRPTTPAGLLTASPAPSVWTTSELWSHLHIPHLDELDLQRVLQNAGEAILEDRGRAEQVIATPDFRAWIGNPNSTKLLVHGDFDSTAAANRSITPFSVLCATMVKAMRLTVAEGKVISLGFFCGCHLAHDEHRGGAAMIRSLSAQLLRQFPVASIESDPRVVMQEVERGNIKELCKLFVHLVRRLPPGKTVFCLIDGINEYESEEYVHGMDDVIMMLLDLVHETTNTSWGAKLKLLLMSPQPTVEVRRVFDQEQGGLLHMAQLPILQDTANFTRFQEQFWGGQP
ncbi:hypothetical protein GGS24DRAFT_468408 [Hypoxylon argillaceum]|nr:hypothetical protein GGS24DRAFT_468408 [Hypoxylon argillaceum]